MRKYIKEHLTVKVFLVTIMLLLTLSAAIYGMVTFGMSNFYLDINYICLFDYLFISS